MNKPNQTSIVPTSIFVALLLCACGLANRASAQDGAPETTSGVTTDPLDAPRAASDAATEPMESEPEAASLPTLPAEALMPEAAARAAETRTPAQRTEAERAPDHEPPRADDTQERRRRRIRRFKGSVAGVVGLAVIGSIVAGTVWARDRRAQPSSSCDDECRSGRFLGTLWILGG